MKVKTSMVVEIEITTDIEEAGIPVKHLGSEEHKERWERQLYRQVFKDLSGYNTLDRLRIKKFHSCKSNK
ncbi:hypothetical protein QTL86_13670 [Cellulosilyticum sp. ST5]|uniref:hypothetical protein n=1 Tax=Cellulosilyticum sp. ST5 TaxID=3055805 RepID=UPI0039773127